MARIQDGRAIVSGVVKASEQRAEIARGTRQESGNVPLTPSQARKMTEDRWPTEEDLPPGYSHHRVVVRSDREIAAQRRAEAVGGSSESQPAKKQPASSTDQAGKVIQDVRAHAAKVAAEYASAKGTPREAAALAAVKETTALVERAAEKI
jgi:hypothetical protein